MAGEITSESFSRQPMIRFQSKPSAVQGSETHKAKGSVSATTASGHTQGKGSVLATTVVEHTRQRAVSQPRRAVETHRAKGSVLVTTAVETQGKGQCLSHNGQEKHKAHAVS